MKKKQIGGLIIAAIVFVVVGAASVLTNTAVKGILNEDTFEFLEGELKFLPPADDYIAVVDVIGTIEEQYGKDIFGSQQNYLHTTTMEYIDCLMDDPENKGILLYIDSPGGTVYESEELYQKLIEYKEYTGNPIWAYMAHYGASGAYMASMASDHIVANPNTVTGSIGVIMSGYDMTGLYEKLGIKYFSIASGANKDSSQMTEEQMQIYQSQVDEAFEKFVDIVEKGRGMSEAEVLKLADGRTYTAKQALENGLIDKISSYNDMQRAMCDELNVYDIYEQDMSEGLFSTLFSEWKNNQPKSEAQILKETAEEMESGVLMYYAEQIR